MELTAGVLSPPGLIRDYRGHAIYPRSHVRPYSYARRRREKRGEANAHPPGRRACLAQHVVRPVLASRASAHLRSRGAIMRLACARRCGGPRRRGPAPRAMGRGRREFECGSGDRAGCGEVGLGGMGMGLLVFKRLWLFGLVDDLVEN